MIKKKILFLFFLLNSNVVLAKNVCEKPNEPIKEVILANGQKCKLEFRDQYLFSKKLLGDDLEYNLYEDGEKIGFCEITGGNAWKNLTGALLSGGTGQFYDQNRYSYEEYEIGWDNYTTEDEYEMKVENLAFEEILPFEYIVKQVGCEKAQKYTYKIYNYYLMDNILKQDLDNYFDDRSINANIADKKICWNKEICNQQYYVCLKFEREFKENLNCNYIKNMLEYYDVMIKNNNDITDKEIDNILDIK